jgi:hypothetical protein
MAMFISYLINQSWIQGLTVYFQILCEHTAVNTRGQREREEYGIIHFIISAVRFIACHVSCYV